MPTGAEWNERYDLGRMPWDLGRANPILEERLTTDPALGGETAGTVFVPGTGRGWDAAALAAAGWRVTAIDLSESAVAAARHHLGGADAELFVGDALDHHGTFDLVFDHTFFCAIALEQRPQFGEMCRRVVADRGRVVSIVFPIGRDPSDGGPPFGMRPGDVSDALGPEFALVELGPERRVPGRAWPHRWGEWRRR